MDGLEVSLYCNPGASRDRIGDVAEDGKGGHVLKVTIAAPPEDGKANKAIIKLLAKEWDIPRTAIQILRGEASRHKKLLLHGATIPLQNKLQNWYDTHIKESNK